MKKHTRVRAEISLDAAARNFEAMRRRLAPGTKMLAVLKADAYGHGALPLAEMIQDYPYIWGIAAAVAEEALELRRGGIVKPILILGHVFPEDYEELILEDVRLTVSELRMARELSEAGRALGKTVHIHLALDTGMSRIGFADVPESVEEILQISRLPYVEIEGLFTHFARADEYDRSPALVQLERYQRFAGLLKEAGLSIPILHCSNSAGILRVPEANLSLVRAGITIYGIYPSDEVEKSIPLEPVMTWKSAVSYVKTIPAGAAVSYGGTYTAQTPRRVATIPVGYADGYPRSLSNKGWVLIHGKKALILGRVCMDQFMVDVTDIPDVKVCDTVTLLGRDGDEIITAQEMGDLSGRFSYELVCDVGKRVPRVYIKDGRIMVTGHRVNSNGL